MRMIDNARFLFGRLLPQCLRCDRQRPPVKSMSHWCVAIAAWSVLCPVGADAQSPGLFTSRLAWESATGDVTNIGFDGLAPVGGFTVLRHRKRPASFEREVRWPESDQRPPAALLARGRPGFLPPFYDWGSGPVLHGPPVPPGPSGEGGAGSHITMSLPGYVTAVGTDIMSFQNYASSFTVVVTTTTGSYPFTVETAGPPNRTFVGFTSSVAIRSVSYYATDGFPVLHNVAFGSAIRLRTTQDQPDDITGPQVHVVYALPSDAIDDQSDTKGAISNSWSPRFRPGCATRRQASGCGSTRSMGPLILPFLRLPRTDADIRSYGASARSQIELEFSKAGLLSPGKILLVSSTVEAATFPAAAPHGRRPSLDRWSPCICTVGRQGRPRATPTCLALLRRL